MSSNLMRQTALMVITALFGGLLGFLIAASNGITLDGHDHHTDHGASPSTHHSASHNNEAHNSGEASQHAHKHDEPLHLPQDKSRADFMAPSLSVMLHRDPISGYNLHLMTEHFTFNAKAAGLEHKDGEGHAHIYVDGKKIARLYGNWFHIGSLADGAKMIKVTLNSNDHRPLYANGKALSAMISLDQIAE